MGYKVTILNSGAVNAFALPTGQLYVTRGLIALASDTSELVVGSQPRDGTSCWRSTPRSARIRHGRPRSSPASSPTWATIPMGTALALAVQDDARELLARAGLEADGVGVGISARAGFDPYGAVRFLSPRWEPQRRTCRSARRRSPRSLDFLSSHPATPGPPAERAHRRTAVRDGPANGEPRPRDLSHGRSIIVYGEDPSEGYVRGHRFLHPKLGFTFTAPDNFTLDNTAQAVIGVREGGTQAMRFDVVRVPAEQSLRRISQLRVDGEGGSGEGLDRGPSPSTASRPHPPAHTAINGSSRSYALRFGTDVYRFIFAAKQKSTESERNARETVNSFRRLTLEEIQAARPLRIKVITVQPGDTVKSLSHRMAGVDRPAERFRVLNGLDNHAQVKVREESRQDRGGLTRESASSRGAP